MCACVCACLPRRQCRKRWGMGVILITRHTAHTAHTTTVEHSPTSCSHQCTPFMCLILSACCSSRYLETLPQGHHRLAPFLNATKTIIIIAALYAHHTLNACKKESVCRCTTQHSAHSTAQTHMHNTSLCPAAAARCATVCHSSSSSTRLHCGPSLRAFTL